MMMDRPFAEVIGDPIAHSLSPTIHNLWLQKLGMGADYRACHVRAEELTDYVAQRRGDANWRGCNVTLPHKIAVLPLVDEISPEVRHVQAANCIVRDGQSLIARNTDRCGVDAALGKVPASACLIGAGGAAHAALAGLKCLATPDVRIIARDASRAGVLLRRFGFPFRVFDFTQASLALSDVEQVINATPLGMTGQPAMPESVVAGLRRTAEDAQVFDMVYAPLETDLLKEARRLGRATTDGLVMLIAQADASFRHLFGRAAPREHDAELRALLSA